MPKRTIKPAERRQQDYLRRNTLQVASVYEARLERARRAELRRVLTMARMLDDADAIAPLLVNQLDESGYLPAWWVNLYTAVGLPRAKATASQLRQEKAAAEEDIWLRSIRSYASTRAGENISIVSGTWKDSLVGVVREVLEEDSGRGIEKVTKEIFKRYTGDLEKWQCRRIAQTEAMIGAAEASAEAANTLSIPFTKQWCISGLGNTRASHEAMDGVIVDKDEPFTLEGGMMMYPHDTSMNAAASEIINCACSCIRRPVGSQSTPLNPVPKPEPAPEPPAAIVPQPVIPSVVAPSVAPAAAPAQAAIDKRVQKFMSELPKDLPEETRKAQAESFVAFEKKRGIKKGKPMSVAKADKQSANPNHVHQVIKDKDGSWKINPDYKAARDNPYNINCATCTPAMQLRLWGFKVTAKPNVKGSLVEKASHNNTFNMWKNADGTAATPTTARSWLAGKGYTGMTPKRYKEFLEEACKEKGNYAVTVTWKGGRSAHATFLQRGADGKLVYIEPQSYRAEKGVKRSIDEICDSVCSRQDFLKGVMRIDDKVFDFETWGDLFEIGK